MNPQQLILDLQDKVAKLEADLADLSGAFYKNNFTSSQSFNKDVVFNSRLRVPVFDSAPTIAEIGDLISVGGQLFICTTPSPSTVFTLVGSQS